MKDFRIEKLAYNLLTYSIKLQKGENILIEIIGEDGIPLAKELIKKASLLGAKPYFNIINYELLRTMLQNATEEQIKLYAKHDESRMNDMDAYIGIRASSNTAELNNISTEIMSLYNKYYTLPVHFEQRVKHTKWCILRYVGTANIPDGEVASSPVKTSVNGLFVLPELKGLNPENLI